MFRSVPDLERVMKEAWMMAVSSIIGSSKSCSDISDTNAMSADLLLASLETVIRDSHSCMSVSVSTAVRTEKTIEKCEINLSIKNNIYNVKVKGIT